MHSPPPSATSARRATALGELRPPEDARPLHGKLLRLFDMNIDFADQTALLAGYVPASERALAPLDRTNRAAPARPRRGARTPARRRRRSSASRRGCGGSSPACASSRCRRCCASRTRTRSARCSRTRSYSTRLRRALIDQDAERVARLLELFREQPSGAEASRRSLARRAIARYNRRYESLNDAYIEVRREEARLDKAFA